MPKQIIRDGLRVIGNDFMEVPYGTTAQRGNPASTGVKGGLRINQTTGKLEWYRSATNDWAETELKTQNWPAVTLTNVRGDELVPNNQYSISSFDFSTPEVPITLDRDKWKAGDRCLVRYTQDIDSEWFSPYFTTVNNAKPVSVNTVSSNTNFTLRHSIASTLRKMERRWIWYMIECTSFSQFTMTPIEGSSHGSRSKLIRQINLNTHVLQIEKINYIRIGASVTMPTVLTLPSQSTDGFGYGTEVIIELQYIDANPRYDLAAGIRVNPQDNAIIWGHSNNTSNTERFYLDPYTHRYVFRYTANGWNVDYRPMPKVMAKSNVAIALGAPDAAAKFMGVVKRGYNFTVGNANFGWAYLHKNHALPSTFVSVPCEIECVGGNVRGYNEAPLFGPVREDFLYEFRVPRWKAEMVHVRTGNTAKAWRSKNPVHGKYTSIAHTGFRQIMPSPRTTFEIDSTDNVVINTVLSSQNHGWWEGDRLILINRQGSTITLDTLGSGAAGTNIEIYDENGVQLVEPVVMTRAATVCLKFDGTAFQIEYRGYY